MKAFLSFTLLLFYLTTNGQHTTSNNAKLQFNRYIDTLKVLSHQVINDPEELQRVNANAGMIKTLVKALKIPYSFNMSFDSLKTISVLTSPDKRFRIFTWHLMFNDGSYRYYGTIQMNNPSGKIDLHPLTDLTYTISKPQDTVTSNSSWYGSQYYRIIPVINNVSSPYYVLLGWKGNNIKSTKKVIEVLSFKGGKPSFGMPVFDGDKERLGKKRIIFEYNRQVSALLNYLPREGTIVFDHLAPPDPKLKNSPELYGPDMSYDGFKLVNGRWKYISDLQLKNDPSALDENFNDPKKPSKGVVNKLK